MMTRKHIGIGIGAACAVLLGILVYRVSGKPMRYEFPGGFKGWLVVRYEDPSCPPLGKQGVFLVVSVPPSGQVCTSTRHPDGWVYCRFEYVYPDGTRTSLPLRTGSDPPGKVQVWSVTYVPDYNWEVDWVGTKEEAEHWGTPPYPWRVCDDITLLPRFRPLWEKACSSVKKVRSNSHSQ